MKSDVLIASGKVPLRLCPVCAMRLDGLTSLRLVDEPGERPTLLTPSQGDLSLCAGCHTMLAFTALGFRIATQEELEAVDPQLRAILAALIAADRPRR